MKNIDLTQAQTNQILSQLASSDAGMDALLTATIEGLLLAERREHNASTKDVSNGFRSRRGVLGHHTLEFSVPRTRHHQFRPVLLAILRDQQERCHALAAALYTKGLTTKEVGCVFEEFFGHRYSQASISRMVESTRKQVDEFLKRPLDEAYPIVYVDSVFIATKRDAVRKEAYQVALGVKADGTREVLGIYNFPSESKEGYEHMFRQLRQRGVQTISLLVSDAFAGTSDAFAAFFKGNHQLCIVHLKRRLLSRVRQRDKANVASELKKVFAADQADPKQAWQRFVDRYKKRYPSFARVKNIDHYFTYLVYDKAIWSMIQTTNWIERLNRVFRRVTRMRAASLTEEAALTLLGAAAQSIDAYRFPIYSLKGESKKLNWSF